MKLNFFRPHRGNISEISNPSQKQLCDDAALISPHPKGKDALKHAQLATPSQRQRSLSDDSPTPRLAVGAASVGTMAQSEHRRTRASLDAITFTRPRAQTTDHDISTLHRRAEHHHGCVGRHARIWSTDDRDSRSSIMTDPHAAKAPEGTREVDVTDQRPTPPVKFSAMPLPPSLQAGELFATRQPSKDSNYRSAFFQKLVDHKINLIVDLRTAEDALPAFADYRPLPGDAKIYGQLRASTNRQVSRLDKLTHYKLDIQNLGVNLSTPPHRLQIVHFTGWEDFSVVTPSDLRALSALITAPLTAGQKVLVHCRGGVGRTGTLITYTQLQASLANIKNSTPNLTSMDLKVEVLNQRAKNIRQRPEGCIETIAQINLIINTLLEDIHNEDIHNEDIHSKGIEKPNTK